MENAPTQQAKATWWLATCVMWSFTWRYLAFAALPAFVAAIVTGVLVGIIFAVVGVPNGPLVSLFGFLLGIIIAFVFIINMFRIMLNKGEFKHFSFHPKAHNPNA